MGKKLIQYTDCLEETFSAMSKYGLLLVSQNKQGKPNAMTIGWGNIGIIWEKPIFVVYVRPSRYTYDLIEQTNDFTVNVPTDKMKEIVSYCGKVSGREHNKFMEKNLTLIPGKTVKSPIIKECIINYECKVVHRNDILKENLDKNIIQSNYLTGNFHRVYFGEILTVLKDK